MVKKSFLKAMLLILFITVVTTFQTKVYSSNGLSNSTIKAIASGGAIIERIPDNGLIPSPLPPQPGGGTVVTQAATNITTTYAYLNATITANTGYSVDYTFEYGLTTSYNYGGGDGTVSSGVATPIFMTGGGISPNTTYHYRVDGCYYLTSAGNSHCTTIYGADMQFTTSNAAPTTQAKNISFASITTTQMAISWTNGNKHRHSYSCK